MKIFFNFKGKTKRKNMEIFEKIIGLQKNQLKEEKIRKKVKKVKKPIE